MDNMPVFVSIDDPKDIHAIVGLLREKIEEARHIMDRIQSLSRDEAHKISHWKTKYEAMVDNMESINKILMQPETM